MIPFSFIHAADLHIGSRFKGLLKSGLDNVISDRIVNASYAAFDNLVNLCIDKNVDFLLIAGDIFDSADSNLKAQLYFRKGLEKLNRAEIKVYAAAGNHDPLASWSKTLKLPENSTLFSDKVETKIFEKDGQAAAAIHGVSYLKTETHSNLAKKFKPVKTADNESLQFDSLPEKLYQIGLLHCNEGSAAGHANYAPCSLKDDLIPASMDYWALGHVHTKHVLHESDPVVIYPGNIQGRHINETGPRGCYAVKIDASGDAKYDFHDLSDVTWHKHDIDISGMTELNQLERKIETLCETTGSDADGRISIIRLDITGRGILHDELRIEENFKDFTESISDTGLNMNPTVLIESVSLNTRRQIDIEERMKIGDFLGELLQISKELKSDETELENIREELSELFGSSRAKKLLNEISDADLIRLIENAESFCVDQFLNE
jgi:DNA repair exonuclease SbcCD nuclease subunit